MMKQNDVEKAIYKKVGEFSGVPNSYLRIENQPTADGKPFVAPTNAACFALQSLYLSTVSTDQSKIDLAVPSLGVVRFGH